MLFDISVEQMGKMREGRGESATVVVGYCTERSNECSTAWYIIPGVPVYYLVKLGSILGEGLENPWESSRND